jgi:hypothetical protein
MATLLSETFLRVHPATELWWQQREQCMRCGNALLTRPYEGETILRCTMLRQGGAHGSGYCIDARGLDGPCGPEAKLFKEITP